MALRKPPLADAHAQSGASFTEFGGWEMPIEFDSIRSEHATVRDTAGRFDVSHMGELVVSGPDATTLMQRLTTNDVTKLDPGDSQYACITDDAGIILDDTMVYRWPDEGGESRYLFIPNAGHDDQMDARWTDYRDEHDLDATVEDVTEEWAMIAVQGPDSPNQLAGPTDGDALDIERFEGEFLDVAGVRSWVARTGYTGEEGFEILCPWDDAETVWAAFDCPPCGLGARDTLRMEMGFLLSGQDFDPETEPRTPHEAGVEWTVALDTEFVGRDALERLDAEGVEERFRGVILLERGVPRHGYEVTDADDTPVGHLTSGTMSPTLGEPIGLGYLSTEAVEPGDRVSVVVRGEPKRAKVVTPPFLDR